MAFLSSKPRERRPVPPRYRKWNRGESPITSLQELEKLLEARFYIFDTGRSAGYHPDVITNWQFRLLARRVKEGRLFPGVRNLEFPFVFEAVWHQAVKGVDQELSRYFVECYELRARFEGKSRDGIITKCRGIVKQYAGAAGKCVVKFNDDERP